MRGGTLTGLARKQEEEPRKEPANGVATEHLTKREEMATKYHHQICHWVEKKTPHQIPHPVNSDDMKSQQKGEQSLQVLSFLHTYSSLSHFFFLRLPFFVFHSSFLFPTL
jgi:hypothetical protein